MGGEIKNLKRTKIYQSPYRARIIKLIQDTSMPATKIADKVNKNDWIENGITSQAVIDFRDSLLAKNKSQEEYLEDKREELDEVYSIAEKHAELCSKWDDATTEFINRAVGGEDVDLRKVKNCVKLMSDLDKDHIEIRKMMGLLSYPTEKVVKKQVKESAGEKLEKARKKVMEFKKKTIEGE